MSVCLDRFAQGLPDPQAYEPEPWAVCEGCGRDIYPGEDCIDLDGSICCDDMDCFIKMTGAQRKEAGVA